MKFGVMSSFLLVLSLQKSIGYHDDSFPEELNSSNWVKDSPNGIDYYDDWKYKEDLLKNLALIEEAIYDTESLEHDDKDAGTLTKLRQLFGSKDDSLLGDLQHDEKESSDKQDLALLLNNLVQKTTKNLVPKEQSSSNMDEDKRSNPVRPILSLFKRLNDNPVEAHKEARSFFPHLFKRLDENDALQRKNPISLFKRYGNRTPFLFKRGKYKK